ncbi:MAG: hypothetical protein K6F23_16465 [Solobacterium sp.]|nr:hypothetical protein [Solobacterium sp.]
MTDLRKLLLAGLIIGFLEGCEKPAETTEQDISVIPGKELFCMTENEDTARQIAEQYEIEFVSFKYGVAIFHTDKDPKAVIDYGIGNDLPALSLNTDVNRKD